MRLIQQLVQAVSFIFLSLILLNCSSDSEGTTQPIPEEPEEMAEDQMDSPMAIIDLTSESGTNIFFDLTAENNTRTQLLTVSNTGDSDLEISEVTAPEGFSLDFTPATIPEGMSQEIIVTFAPTMVGNFEGNIEFTSNATSGSDAIAISGEGVSSTLEDNAILLNQQEVDDFGAIGYTRINGRFCIGDCDQFIMNSDITDLSPLSSVTSVNRLEIARNPLLEAIDGLQNINTVDWRLSVIGNENLQNVDGLANIDIAVLGELLQIGGNAQLVNIDGLSQIASVGILFVTDNPLLENINGLSALATVNGDFRIERNPFIQDLDGLANLTAVAGNVTIRSNERLRSFCGIIDLIMDQVNSVGGTVFPITYNRYNLNISGVCEFDTPLGIYGGDLTLRGQVELDTFTSFQFEGIIGDLRIVGIPSRQVTALDALENLRSVQGDLEIIRTQETNMEGLTNIERISGNFQVTGNEMLDDYCALVPLFQNPEGLVGDYFSSENLLELTREELEVGTCTPQ